MTNSANPQSRGSEDLDGVEVLGEQRPEWDEILSKDALRFVATLERSFRATRRELLACRAAIQRSLDEGALPDFLPMTRWIRDASWRVAPPPADLTDRRVEITGPVDRKMIINALNSGANVFMADFEDSNSPTWENVVDGQLHVRDAVRGTLEHVDGESGKTYRLGERTATLVVRPRGWHLDEKHVLVDGEPVSASIFDFALYFFHNADRLLAKGTGPYFYLAKLENHHEARLWNEVFLAAESELGLRVGTIRATVLIETILAAFEMDEILWELRDHVVGLNCGRWDYIFSFIKKFRSRPDFVLPDRSVVTMEKHFLRSYSQLLIATCHRRGAYAMGGMAAQIPIKRDPALNEAALAKVRADKRREAHDGHDGTWVAHPGLVGLAKAEFDEVMEGPHQLDNLRRDVWITARDLLEVPEGAITEKGLRHDVNVGILYVEAWLRGKGCVPLYDLMEDAATAEISRAQVWQWLRHGASLEDGRVVDVFLVKRVLDEELARIRSDIGEAAWQGGRFELAASLFETLVTSTTLADFLTLVAYEHI
ncbi:MAG: malate synthase A [bacterium]